MATKFEVSPELLEQLTPELLQRLMGIRGRGGRLKRSSIVMMAFGRANGTPTSVLFELPNVCDERTWSRWCRDDVFLSLYEDCLTLAMNIKIPGEMKEWLTQDLLNRLNQLDGEWVGLKRSSIIMLAFARAKGTPFSKLWPLPYVCSETTWYNKWRKNEAILSLYEDCVNRARDWRDMDISEFEAQKMLLLRRNLAEWSAESPVAVGVVMTNPDEKGQVRINAAETLMDWRGREKFGKRTGSGGGSIHASIDVEHKVDALIADALRDLGLGDIEGDIDDDVE